MAAVRGAQAIQRLTGTERYQELRPAVARLEKTAAELRGPGRLTTVRRWVAVLRCVASVCAIQALKTASMTSHVRVVTAGSCLLLLHRLRPLNAPS